MPEDELHDDLAAVWDRVQDELRASLPASTFRLWLEALRPIRARGTTLYVEAPASTRAWVERRYAGALESAIQANTSGLERVVCVEATSISDPPPADESPPGQIESPPIDPSHTFERFVIGSGNRLAHSAALAVAELPGEAYNPLFLHGEPGLGKSHLLGAIDDYLRRRRPELTIHYTTAERFTTDFVGALRKHGPERFKQRYRKLDALLIDDVQALEGKEHTQEEFVHTFNALHAQGKQIVLSSDRPPEAIARLAERLRDRFGWGLSVELSSPDLRTRIALLWRMTLEEPLELAEPAVLGEIASIAVGNVRRLQGAMTRVAAVSSLLREPITQSLVHRTLQRDQAATTPITPEPAEGPSVTTIQAAASSVLGVSREDLLSNKRTARISQARQIAIYLTRDLTPLSLAQIAREFNRDHSTVLYALRAISRKLDLDSDTAQLLAQTRALLGTSSQRQTPASHPLETSPPSLSTSLRPTESR